MSYVTRGKVQVELKTGNDEIEIRIDPVQEYAVKHKKDALIVFIDDIDDGPENQPLDAIAFKNTQKFTTKCTKCCDIARVLTNAAFKQIVIEIKIKEKPILSSPPGSDPIEIESIRIPGTFGSDKA